MLVPIISRKRGKSIYYIQIEMQNKHVLQPLGEIDKLLDIYVNTKGKNKKENKYVFG